MVRAARGRVPVSVGVGAMTTGEAGAEGVLLVGPYYEPASEEELYRHVAAVAEEGGLPVCLYNNPAGAGYDLKPRLIARIARLKGVVALKDTTWDLRRLYEVRELCGRRLQVLSGQDTLQFHGFVAGAEACIWGAPNAVPYHSVELFDRVVERGDVAGGARLWAKLYPVSAFLESEGYVAAVKAGTSLRGWRSAILARPCSPRREAARPSCPALEGVGEGFPEPGLGVDSRQAWSVLLTRPPTRVRGGWAANPSRARPRAAVCSPASRATFPAPVPPRWGRRRGVTAGRHGATEDHAGADVEAGVDTAAAVPSE